MGSVLAQWFKPLYVLFSSLLYLQCGLMECLNNMLLKWLTWHSVYALEDDLDISLNSHTSMWVSYLLPAACLCPERKQAIETLCEFTWEHTGYSALSFYFRAKKYHNGFSRLISSHRCNKRAEVLPQFYLLWVSVMKKSLPVLGVPDELTVFVSNMRLNVSINFRGYNIVTTLSTFFLFYLIKPRLSPHTDLCSNLLALV